MSGQAYLKINEKEWFVSLAVASWELEQGLGGLPDLEAGTGMLFDLGFAQTIHVTTVPMLFPLDIAFLSADLKVTEIYQNVEPGYLVTSTQPARYFIEVNVGDLTGIELGNQVSLEILPFQDVPVESAWESAMFSFMGFTLL